MKLKRIFTTGSLLIAMVISAAATKQDATDFAGWRVTMTATVGGETGTLSADYYLFTPTQNTNSSYGTSEPTSFAALVVFIEGENSMRWREYHKVVSSQEEFSVSTKLMLQKSSDAQSTSITLSTASGMAHPEGVVITIKDGNGTTIATYDGTSNSVAIPTDFTDRTTYTVVISKEQKKNIASVSCNLKKGWNFVGNPFEELQAITVGQESELSVFDNSDYSLWNAESVPSRIDSVSAVGCGKAFWVYANESSDIMLTGVVPSAAASTAQMPTGLSTGWSAVSLLGSQGTLSVQGYIWSNDKRVFLKADEQSIPQGFWYNKK